MKDPLEDVSFPELTNNQQNVWLLRDELNATRRWIKDHVVFEEDMEEDPEDEA